MILVLLDIAGDVSFYENANPALLNCIPVLLTGAHVFGANVGMSVINANTGISKNNNFGYTAPIPDLGIWGGYAFCNRFAINFDINYLSLTIGSNSGRVLASNVIFVYRLIDKLDLSLGYAGLNSKVDVVKQDIDGQFTWGCNGPVLGINFSFGRKSWLNGKNEILIH